MANPIERRLRWLEVRTTLCMESYDDWPDALPIVSIAWLYQGSKNQKSQAFYAMLDQEIKSGCLSERGEDVRVRNPKNGQEAYVKTIRADDLAALLGPTSNLGIYLDTWLSSATRQDIHGDEKSASRFFKPEGGITSRVNELPTKDLMRAGRICGFDGRDGWPDALSIQEFCSLQFHQDEAARNDLLRALWGFEWTDWLSHNGVTVIRDNAPGPGLCRVSAAECLRRYGVEPSHTVKNWFDSVGEKHSVVVKPKGSSSESSQAALESVLVECEVRATATGESFSVTDMPGQIPQFWDLCKRLEPAFKNIALSSFKRYTKAGRCKWSLQAKANPDATSLYKRLFPEAWGNPGAVSTKTGKK